MKLSLGMVEPQCEPAVKSQPLHPMPREATAFGAKKGFVGHTEKGMLHSAAAKLTESINANLFIIHVILSYNLIDLKRAHPNTFFLGNQRLHIYFITYTIYSQTNRIK